MNNCPCSQEIQRQIHKRDEAIDSIREWSIYLGIKAWIEVFGPEDTFNEIERAKSKILVELSEPNPEMGPPD